MEETIAKLKKAIAEYERSPITTFDSYRAREDFRRIATPSTIKRLIELLEEAKEIINDLTKTEIP